MAPSNANPPRPDGSGAPINPTPRHEDIEQPIATFQTPGFGGRSAINSVPGSWEEVPE